MFYLYSNETQGELCTIQFWLEVHLMYIKTRNYTKQMYKQIFTGPKIDIQALINKTNVCALTTARA